MIDNHVTASRLTNAHRIQDGISCAECGGTGSVPWDMEDMFGEMSFYLHGMKKQGKNLDFVRSLRILMRWYQEGQECRDCNGTGVV